MFHFSLQTVLDYRKTIEEKLVIDFAAKQRQLESENKALSLLRDKKQALLCEMQESGLKKQDISDISFYFSSIHYLKTRENEQLDRIEVLSGEIHETREKLLATVKQIKILETLKKKKQQEYSSHIEAVERKNMDEAALRSFERSRP